MSRLTMARIWAGVALLSASWLVGLGYYHAPIWPAWTIMIATGALLLAGAMPHLPARREAGLAIALLLPALLLMPWPYRAAPALMTVGLIVVLVSGISQRSRSIGSGLIAAGGILLIQGLGLLAYAHVTARSHELPAPLAEMLAGIARLMGIDAAVSVSSGRDIALFSMRQVHLLGATWELLLDPATFCFLIGGLALMAVRVDRRGSSQKMRGQTISCSAFALCVACWLPIRAGLLIAFYMQRVLRADSDAPLHLMDPFWNPWVLAALLIGPVLLTWRLVHMADSDRGPAEATDRPLRSPASGAAFSLKYAGSLGLCALGMAALTAAMVWDPPGSRKAGRVMVDEYHSDWEPTSPRFDTERYGPRCSYDYSCAFDYCSRFYTMDRIDQPLSEDALRDCDVLMVKTPDARPFEPTEVAAIRRFVEKGGGLLLIGEHTNVYRTGTHLNSIAREFGFSFRPDCLFGIDSFFDQHYEHELVAHPIVQRVSPMEFATSCSIDPGWSAGRAAILSTGLKNRLADYHASNFYPQAEDDAQMRYGAFVQLWTTNAGKGRVAAYTDSTQFSSFCLFDAGKSDMLMGMIEWLNRSPANIQPQIPLLILGLALLGLAVWSSRSRQVSLLVWIGAGLLGWSASAAAIHAAQLAAMPSPVQLRPMTRVLLDQTVCSTRLPTNGFIAGKSGEFGLFEQWILRLGYFTGRASGSDLLKGNMAVFLTPDRTISREFRDEVAQYVQSGGHVLVLDSPENAHSSANSLLYPFGLKLAQPSEPLQGQIEPAAGFPAIPVGPSLEVTGGLPLATLNGKPVAARVAFGKGSVTAIGFGSRFDDANMGVLNEVVPDAELRKVYDFEFGLLRKLIEGSPATRPQ